ncbi:MULTISPECIES: hypothetical protein [Protofrankia]|uniref:F5/8 type C domain-containing protein n=1 Tax=Protofrankia coriariae TaxID=1562887 RepID=A0ABR5F4C9_9ACTN|nr:MULTISPECIES: hypothetical protein [Protofrankia]KLL11586.1 hypothetical protein FrCorBMG51_11170 [Protofrankia coriariae]ONH35723.1 hypothetical protein BL254_10565 [Protofrankia sp. BMG5.30]
MRNDIKNHLSVVQSLAPASRTAAANGTGVDLANYDGAMIVIDAGAAGGTTPSFTFKVQESADNSTFTAVAASNLDGAEPVITDANDLAVYTIGYHGIKRYVRVAITVVAGTTPTLVASATVVRGLGRVKP